MARCSCAGSSCSCLISAGGGTTVTGSGTATDPYIISAAPVPAQFTQSAAGPLDLSAVNASAVVNVLLAGNVTSVILPVDGIRLEIVFVQDAVGSRTVSFPAPVEWPGGTQPVVTTTANSADWFTLLQVGGVWYGVRTGANLT